MVLGWVAVNAEGLAGVAAARTACAQSPDGPLTPFIQAHVSDQSPALHLAPARGTVFIFFCQTTSAPCRLVRCGWLPDYWPQQLRGVLRHIVLAMGQLRPSCAQLRDALEAARTTQRPLLGDDGTMKPNCPLRLQYWTQRGSACGSKRAHNVLLDSTMLAGPEEREVLQHRLLSLESANALSKTEEAASKAGGMREQFVEAYEKKRQECRF